MSQRSSLIVKRHALDQRVGVDFEVARRKELLDVSRVAVRVSTVFVMVPYPINFSLFRPGNGVEIGYVQGASIIDERRWSHVIFSAGLI